VESKRSHLLAHGKQDAATFNVPFVTFTPGAEPFIGVYEGFLAYDPGGEATPAFVLKTDALLHILHTLELDWFFPYLERMARGEAVDLSEVESVFCQLTGRRMESSTVPLHFSFMGRRK
jgi:hypothetical protein